eukprot:s1863_g4.t1
MLHITMSLPSGRSENLTISESSKVGDLKVIAQNSFGASCLKLVTAEGHVLNSPEEYLGAKVREGDHITAIAQPAIKLAATSRAFALWRCESDGIVTWGNPDYGGNSLNVQHQLQNVQHVKAKERGFVAYLEDGSVVCWGQDFDFGGDNKVKEQVAGALQVCSTQVGPVCHFGAILADGSVGM